ncbi:MAG: hypothetical protein K9H49_09540 [Bacteroidales bacterium]|nr:hypothetical protein [Bacteroidales bacterium]MCF8391947.1 hypothetical protein [Bacteroidales bacterium]
MSKENHVNYDYDFSSTDFLIYMWNKRVPLFIVSFLAGIASILISFSITPKFRSTVVMFPTTSTSISKNLLADNYSGRASMYEIGEEEQSEQLMQILNSEEIKNRIIEKYNLMEHYGIEPDSKFPMTQLYAEFSSNINFELTQYLSVIIDVLDADPQIAADIANDIASLVDTVYNRMLKQRAIDGFKLVEKEYNAMVINIEELEDSIDIIRSLGINHYEAQSERYHEALGRAINENNIKAQRIFEEKLAVLAKYGGTYTVLRDQLQLSVQRLSRMHQRYQEAQIEAEQNLPHIFIVDSAFKAEKKAYPKKSIIVIISTLAAFLLTLITLIVAENIKKKVKA